MFQIKDNKVYQLVKFTPTSALTLGIYSTPESVGLAKRQEEMNSSNAEGTFLVVKEWLLNGLTLSEIANSTDQIRVYSETLPYGTFSTYTESFCVINGVQLTNGNNVVTFPDRVAALVAGILVVRPEMAAKLRNMHKVFTGEAYTLGDLSFIREYLSELCNILNIQIKVD